jgi:ketosteroid isomerase-like protein
MSRENVEAVRAVYEEWAQGNFRAGGDLWDRRVVFVPIAELPDAGDYFGLEGVTTFMRAFLQPWTNFTITAGELIEAGDSVVVVARQRGVGRESGLVAELEQQFQVWTFRGRMVIRFEAFRERAEALEAVGLRE